MTIKISRLDDFGSDFDTNFIEAALEQDAREEMSPAEIETKDFQENGIIPTRVAKTNASSFGLRHAYFDVWKPENLEIKSVWQSQTIDGVDYIVRNNAE